MDEGWRRLDATVRGRVQGVGFRVFALRRAAELGVTGWVSNEADGTVHCVAEGEQGALEALLAALRDGPPAARVGDVAASWSPATGEFARFGVRSGWHGGD
jgi:acylphosphatase